MTRAPRIALAWLLPALAWTWGCASSGPRKGAATPSGASPSQTVAAAPAAGVDPWAGAHLVEPPTAGPPQPFKVRGMTRFSLRNGLPVIVLVSRDLPTVDILMTVRGGSLDESADRRGLSSFAAQMLRQGTKKRTADQISETIDSLGGSLEADATDEATLVHCGALTKDFGTCLDLLADVSLNPAFPESEMSEIRDRLTAAIEHVRDSKDGLAQEHFVNQLFGEHHPRGIIATKETVKAITRADLAAFHKKYFTAKNALLTVAGDVDTTKVKAALERALGALPKGKPIHRTEPQLPEHKGIHALLVDKPDLAQTRIALGHAGIRHRDPDFFATLLVNYTLGGGAFSSRLMERVRAKGGKTYGIHSHFDAKEWLGAFSVGVDVPNAHVVSTLEDIREELGKMRTSGPTEAELRDAKANLAGSYPMMLQSAADVAEALVQARLHGLDFDYVENYPLKLAAVTPAQARAAAAKHLDPDDLVLVMVGKADVVAPALAKAGIPAERIGYMDPISAGARKQAHTEAKSSFASFTPGEMVKAKDLIGQALRAAGGEDRLKSIRDVTITGKLTVSMAGQERKVTVKKYTLLPDRHRTDMNMGGLDMELVVTKDLAFRKVGPQVTDLPPDDATKMRKDQHQWSAIPTSVLVQATDPAAKVRIADPVEKDGRKLEVVEMLDPSGERTTLFIDAKTRLLAKISETDGSAELDDWRELPGGLKYPFKMRLEADQQMEMEIEEVKINTGLSPDLFKR